MVQYSRNMSVKRIIKEHVHYFLEETIQQQNFSCAFIIYILY